MLLNNAGVGPKGTSWAGLDAWHKVFDVNVFGCVLHMITPQMRTDMAHFAVS